MNEISISVNTLQIFIIFFGDVTYIRYLCIRVKKQSNNNYKSNGYDTYNK